MLYAMISAVDLFLSTPSARRATCAALAGSSFVTYFYPRPPRGGRLCRGQILGFLNHFYPRPPRGGRRRAANSFAQAEIFLSTPSARRATAFIAGSFLAHADFYPRPPRGGRLWTATLRRSFTKFLSTPSARRATCNAWSHGVAIGISIHALREEGDSRQSSCCWCSSYFYPRPPRGGRPERFGHQRNGHRISIHALREEGDQREALCRGRLSISIHALREEGDG